jgi:hypothetical protein
MFVIMRIVRAVGVAVVLGGAVVAGTGAAAAAPAVNHPAPLVAPHPAPAMLVTPLDNTHPAPFVVTPLCVPVRNRCASGSAS